MVDRKDPITGSLDGSDLEPVVDAIAVARIELTRRGLGDDQVIAVLLGIRASDELRLALQTLCELLPRA